MSDLDKARNQFLVLFAEALAFDEEIMQPDETDETGQHFYHITVEHSALLGLVEALGIKPNTDEKLLDCLDRLSSAVTIEPGEKDNE